MRKLLVVDDDSGVRLVLSHCLDHMGFAVRQSPNGLDALKALEEETFDAVIMDINMPPISGIETCARIHHQFPAPPPVWLMTGMWTPEAQRAGLAAGARKILIKPFNCEQLVKELADGGIHAT